MTCHQIDASARVSPLADLETSTRGSRLVIGPRVMIDAFVKIKFAGGDADVVIGAESQLNSGCVVYSGNGVTLGTGVRVAANCTFAPVNHAYMDADRSIWSQGFLPSRGGIVVADDVWIGANCVFLDGTLIGKGAVIAAGTIVRGEVPAFAVIAGNPWKILKHRLGASGATPGTGRP